MFPKNLRTLSFVLVIGCSQALLAAEGEVKEINHDNLISYRAIPEASCTSPYNYFTVWIAVTYREGAASKSLAYPIRNYAYSSGGCPAAMEDVWGTVGQFNVRLNDILGNNLTAKDGLCSAQYLVATLRQPVTLPDGSSAVRAMLATSQRVVHCP